MSGRLRGTSTTASLTTAGFNRWVDFYEPRMRTVEFNGYREYFDLRYRHFLCAIHDVGADIKPKRIVEVGCGTAMVTSRLRFLHDKGIGRTRWLNNADRITILVDSDPCMLAFAARWLPESVQVLADIREEQPASQFYHGHGVLEHFSDTDILKILELHRQGGAKAAVHYVPGNKYKTRSFGDERLMPLEFWRDLTKPTEVTTFNDDYDYCLIWRWK